MNLRASVGRRLFLLVACQTAIAFLLVLLAYRTISKAAADYTHMYQFQFKSLAAICDAMQEAATLPAGSHSWSLDGFYRRYRADFEVASGVTPDAIQFRKDLIDAGAADLARHETEVLNDLHKRLKTGGPEEIRRDLADLYSLSVRYAVLDNSYVLRRASDGRLRLIILGLSGMALILMLGVRVRRAVAPRIQNLVSHVRRFEQTGTYEKICSQGSDDIAVLANAIDAGFSAIASRVQDRDQFLSIVAHELKTPVTSIYGYASLLVRHSMSTKDIDIALQAINRQSWRLTRLIDAVFLTRNARDGALHYEPAPLDLSELVMRVMDEMGPLLSGKGFFPQIDPQISVLGDQALLEHAFWSLFTTAARFSGKDMPLNVSLFTVQHSARLTVDIDDHVSVAEVQELFTPFGRVEYETGSGVRSAIGLYLCREIIKLHNGTLKVELGTEHRPEFLVELPI